MVKLSECHGNSDDVKEPIRGIVILQVSSVQPISGDFTFSMVDDRTRVCGYERCPWE